MDFQLSVMDLRRPQDWGLKTIFLWHKSSRYPELYIFIRYGNIYGIEIHIFSFLAINFCGDKNVVWIQLLHNRNVFHKWWREINLIRVCSLWFDNTDVSYQNFLIWPHLPISMLAKMTCYCYNLLWNIVLLQVLISESISNLASVSFLIPVKHFLCWYMSYVATPMQRLILRLFQCMWIPNPKSLRNNVDAKL